MSIILDSSARDLTRARYAGFWVRVGATLIDILVLLPLIGASIYFTSYAPSFIGVVVVTVLSALYKPVMEGMYGATLGKKALKLNVLKEDGSAISVSEGFTRYLPWIPQLLLAIYVSYLMFNLPGFEDVDGFMEAGAFQMENQEALGSWPILQQVAGVLPLVSALFLLGNNRKQSAHDMLADTVVIYTEDEAAQGLM